MILTWSLFIGFRSAINLFDTPKERSKLRWKLSIGTSVGSGIWALYLISIATQDQFSVESYDPIRVAVSYFIITPAFALFGHILTANGMRNAARLLSLWGLAFLGSLAALYVFYDSINTFAKIDLSQWLTTALVAWIAALTLLLAVTFHWISQSGTHALKPLFIVSILAGFGASVSLKVILATPYDITTIISSSGFSFLKIDEYGLATMIFLGVVLVQGNILIRMRFKASFQTTETDPDVPISSSAIRVRFLGLFALLMLGGVSAAVNGINYSISRVLINEQINNSAQEKRVVVERLIEDGIKSSASAMNGIILGLDQDQTLVRLFQDRDREALYRYAKPLYDQLNDAFDITHFYFIEPDSTSFLRAHTPDRYGDTIRRITLEQAKATDQQYWGVEVGVLGTLTLRFVHPWHDKKTGELIGYLELGKEIDKILHSIPDFMGMHTSLFLHKKYLDEQKWQEGMKSLGRPNTWSQFDDIVTILPPPEDLVPLLQDHKLAHLATGYDLENGEEVLRATIAAIKDVREKNVAGILLMDNVTTTTATPVKTLWAGVAAILIFSLPIIMLFRRQAHVLEGQVASEEKELRRRADFDVLTGLYSRRRFDELIDEEIERASRYEHDLSLMMLDIDHFKLINDTHGHQAGDKIIAGIGEAMLNSKRSVDKACRYGGEEFVLILPETSLEQATVFAERLRQTIQKTKFESEVTGGQITVSIGVAELKSCSAHTALHLVHAADTALYEAKESGRNCVRRYFDETTPHYDGQVH